MQDKKTMPAQSRCLNIMATMLFISLLSTTRDTNAMAGFFGEYTLFSAISGRIVKGDQPVAGATIVQAVKLGTSATVTRTTTSSEDGSFSFAAITRKKGLSSLLPQQFSAGQNMTITADGQSYEGWVFTKLDPAPESENNGERVEMTCDIASEADFTGKTYGICKLVKQN